MTKDLIKYFTYILALQKCSHSSDYTIHGLWVDYTRGGYPEFCRNIPFDEKTIEPLRSQLDTFWPSCYNGPNKGLWKHEWLKHGTCFNPNITLYDYFNSTLELYHKYKHKCDNQHKRDCLISTF